MKNVYVSMNEEAIRARIKAVMNAILSARFSGSLMHENTDGYYTPAEWDIDLARTIRHSMTTSGSMSYNAGTMTISISLDYTVIDITEHDE